MDRGQYLLRVAARSAVSRAIWRAPAWLRWLVVGLFLIAGGLHTSGVFADVSCGIYKSCGGVYSSVGAYQACKESAYAESYPDEVSCTTWSITPEGADTWRSRCGGCCGGPGSTCSTVEGTDPDVCEPGEVLVDGECVGDGGGYCPDGVIVEPSNGVCPSDCLANQSWSLVGDNGFCLDPVCDAFDYNGDCIDNDDGSCADRYGADWIVSDDVCCYDGNGNGQCDKDETCGELCCFPMMDDGEGGCCMDTDEDSTCDPIQCGSGAIQIPGGCCADVDSDGHCDYLDEGVGCPEGYRRLQGSCVPKVDDPELPPEIEDPDDPTEPPDVDGTKSEQQVEQEEARATRETIRIEVRKASQERRDEALSLEEQLKKLRAERNAADNRLIDALKSGGAGGGAGDDEGDEEADPGPPAFTDLPEVETVENARTAAWTRLQAAPIVVAVEGMSFQSASGACGISDVNTEFGNLPLSRICPIYSEVLAPLISIGAWVMWSFTAARVFLMG